MCTVGGNSGVEKRIQGARRLVWIKQNFGVPSGGGPWDKEDTSGVETASTGVEGDLIRRCSSRQDRP